MGNTIPYFPPVAPYPTGVTSASRRGLELREWNKTCTLALKKLRKNAQMTLIKPLFLRKSTPNT